jgi:hypothetical protein
MYPKDQIIAFQALAKEYLTNPHTVELDSLKIPTIAFHRVSKYCINHARFTKSKSGE